MRKKYITKITIKAVQFSERTVPEQHQKPHQKMLLLQLVKMVLLHVMNMMFSQVVIFSLHE